MEKQIKIQEENFTAVHTLVETASLDGETVLRVAKKEKLEEFDENTYAKVNGISFHNGIIEVKLLSRLLPDAPEFARGFIGLVFRANPANSEFEAFYIRPTNGRSCQDPVRRSHGCQYFSYPGYTFGYFREHGITIYEAPVADMDLNEWIAIKAVIQDGRGKFYINESEAPVLVVEDMKHGPEARGAVGIYVDTGTEAFVSELLVTCVD